MNLHVMQKFKFFKILHAMKNFMNELSTNYDIHEMVTTTTH